MRIHTNSVACESGRRDRNLQLPRHRLPEPRALADFYERLLGLDRVEETDEWVTLGNSSLAPRIALQGVAEFVSPDWHSSGAPQQMHVDVLVENLDVAQAAVLSLGARLLEGSQAVQFHSIASRAQRNSSCKATFSSTFTMTAVCQLKTLPPPGRRTTARRQKDE